MRKFEQAVIAEGSRTSMKWLAIGATLIFGLRGAPAVAWFNTEQLQAVCEAGLYEPNRDNPKYALCTGLIIGTLMTDSLERNMICLPENVDTVTAMRMFVARAKAEKDKKIEGTVTLFRAFAERYPCS